jgi:hypothetical protein
MVLCRVCLVLAAALLGVRASPTWPVCLFCTLITWDVFGGTALLVPLPLRVGVDPGVIVLAALFVILELVLVVALLLATCLRALTAAGLVALTLAALLASAARARAPILTADMVV